MGGWCRRPAASVGCDKHFTCHTPTMSDSSGSLDGLWWVGILMSAGAQLAGVVGNQFIKHAHRQNESLPVERRIKQTRVCCSMSSPSSFGCVMWRQSAAKVGVCHYYCFYPLSAHRIKWADWPLASHDAGAGSRLVAVRRHGEASYVSMRTVSNMQTAEGIV